MPAGAGNAAAGVGLAGTGWTLFDPGLALAEKTSPAGSGRPGWPLALWLEGLGWLRPEPRLRGVTAPPGKLLGNVTFSLSP